MSLGFYVNLQRCIGCKTCQVACKDRHDLQQAGPRPRRVGTFECGTYPDVDMFHLVVSCNHCERPACVAGCPTGALFKSDDGTVLHIDDRCVVCRNCMTVCPYGAPQFDEVENMIVKCDGCKALRADGRNPVCVDACPMRAIEFGDMDELRAKHGGTVSELPVLPSAGLTEPNLLVDAPAGALRERFPRGGAVSAGARERAAAPAADEARERAAGLEELLRARAYLFELFHKLTGAAPDAEVLDALLGEATAACAGAYAEDDETMAGFARFLRELAAREDRTGLLDAARDEYTRLFVGPAALPAPVWESPYRTKRADALPGEHAFRARRVPRARPGAEAGAARARRPRGACVRVHGAAGARRAGERSRPAMRRSLRWSCATSWRSSRAHLTNWLGAFARAERQSKTAVLYPQARRGAGGVRRRGRGVFGGGGVLGRGRGSGGCACGERRVSRRAVWGPCHPGGAAALRHRGLRTRLPRALALAGRGIRTDD